MFTIFKMVSMQIRLEQPEDIAAIRTLTTAAFLHAPHTATTKPQSSTHYAAPAL